MMVALRRDRAKCRLDLWCFAGPANAIVGADLIYDVPRAVSGKRVFAHDRVVGY